MWNRLKWVLALALIPAALGQAGCNLDKTNRPALAGPSELAASLGLSANPDQLTANGSSVIEATLRGPDGNPAANAPVVFDLLARGASNFSDIGVLSKLNESRPIPGGPNRPETVTGTTNGNGVARVRYWSPFRTDQENDIVVTVTGRPEGNDFRDAVFRQVDIFLRAANRPNFPGGVACSILVEPVQTFYDVWPIDLLHRDPDLRCRRLPDRAIRVDVRQYGCRRRCEHGDWSSGAERGVCV